MFCNALLADGIEALAQSALEKYTSQWVLSKVHKTEVEGSETSEWDEYNLKSPNLQHFVLRKYYHNRSINKNVYQIFETDKRGTVVAKPTDDQLSEILRHNKIANISNYTKILENVEQYKKNNVKASIAKVATSHGEEIGIQISSNAKKIGHIEVARDSSLSKNTLTGSALDKPSKIAYFRNIRIEEKYRGLGLSYPLMCVAFLALKEIYNKEYVTLMDSTAPNMRGIYEKMGFKAIFGNLKYAAINELLNSDRCRHLNR